MLPPSRDLADDLGVSRGVVVESYSQLTAEGYLTAQRGSSTRVALLAWARERGALIVEDDYDVEYRFGRNPMAALQELAPDLVAFVGTTSKTLPPALRLAWVVPPAHLMDDLEDVLLAGGVAPPTLDQVAMASFIEDAALERHLRSMRRRYRAKREVLVGALASQLPDVRVSGTAAGLHVLAWLPDGADERATAMRARQVGVGLHELHRHCTTSAPSRPALLLELCPPQRVRAARRDQPASCWPRSHGEATHSRVTCQKGTPRSWNLNARPRSCGSGNHR